MADVPVAPQPQKAAIRSERREEIKLRLEYLKLVFSILGVGGILFGVLQLATNSESDDLMVYEKMAGEWDDNLKNFTQDSKLRPYFFDNLQLSPNDENRNAVLAVADLRLEAMDDVLTYAETRWQTSGVWKTFEGWFQAGPGHPLLGWKNTFTVAFQNSAVLCARYEETRETFGLLQEIGDATCVPARK